MNKYIYITYNIYIYIIHTFNHPYNHIFSIYSTPMTFAPVLHRTFPPACDRPPPWPPWRSPAGPGSW